MKKVMHAPTQKNKTIAFAILVLLAIIAGFFFKFYNDEREDTDLIKEKVIAVEAKQVAFLSSLESSLKKISEALPPRSSSQDAPPAASLANGPAASLLPVEELPTDDINKDKIDDLPSQEFPLMQEVPTAELSQKLNDNMEKIKTLGLEGLENNIALANELLSRFPESYAGHKAKLISLLIEEGKLRRFD